MTSLLAGVDLSTKQLHCALIPLDADHGDPAVPPVTFRSVSLEQTNDQGSRFRSIREGVSELLWMATTNEVVSCWVECPRPPHHLRGTTSARLMAMVYGAVMASIPLHIVRNSLEPQEWRRTLGLNPSLSKPEAIAHAHLWIESHTTTRPANLDEHHAEALLVALAGRHENQKAWAA